MAIDTPTLDELCEELVRLAALASPAPWNWHWRADPDAPGSVAWNVDSGRSTAIAMCPRYGAGQFAGDAELIVRLRNALPLLLAERTALREEVMHLAAAVNGESCACSGCKPR